MLMNVMLIKNKCNLIKESTCFKRAGSCIDLILTNSKYSFQYFSSIEIGLSHHHLIFSMMKTKLALEEPERLVLIMIILKKSYHQNLILATRTT